MDGNRACSIFIRHSSWKMKDADKFCMISVWSFWRQIEDSLPVLKIESCEHTTNNIPTFSPQKRNLEIGPSERLLQIFGTKNRILNIWSCERALWLCKVSLPSNYREKSYRESNSQTFIFWPPVFHRGFSLQSAKNRRKECHRFWLRLRHAVILISNDRTSASKKINGMTLIQTLTVSTTAFERTKEKF